jgi:hypothetical protein
MAAELEENLMGAGKKQKTKDWHAGESKETNIN